MKTIAKRAGRPVARAELSDFRAATATRPLWANLHGHPSIWIRWREHNEDQVESEQAITFGNRHVGIEVAGRIARCGKYGDWYIGDWRPMCGACMGLGQVEVFGDHEVVRNAIVETLNAGLFYMLVALDPCPGCLGHPGWVA